MLKIICVYCFPCDFVIYTFIRWQQVHIFFEANLLIFVFMCFFFHFPKKNFKGFKWNEKKNQFQFFFMFKIRNFGQGDFVYIMCMTSKQYNTMECWIRNGILYVILFVQKVNKTLYWTQIIHVLFFFFIKMVWRRNQ